MPNLFPDADVEPGWFGRGHPGVSERFRHAEIDCHAGFVVEMSRFDIAIWRDGRARVKADKIADADSERFRVIFRLHYGIEPHFDAVLVAFEIAKRVAGNSPVSNFAIMNVLPRIAEQDRASGFVMESLTAAVAQGSDEAKNRIKAFLEKRAAKVERK